MGKLAVVLVAVFAFQGVFAGVARNNFDNQNVLNDLVKEILSASVGVVDTLQRGAHASLTSESQDFGDNVQEVVRKFEELKNKKDEEAEIVDDVLEHLHQVLSNLKGLKSASDPTHVMELKTTLAPNIKNVAEQLQLLVKTLQEENLEGNLNEIYAKYFKSVEEFQRKLLGTGSTTNTFALAERGLSKSVAQASEELYQEVKKAASNINENQPVIRLCIRDLAIITERLEAIASDLNIKTLVVKLRNVLVLLNKLGNREVVPLDNLKQLLDDVTKNFDKVLEGNTHPAEIKQIVAQYTTITKRLHSEVSIGIFHPRYGRSEYFRHVKHANEIVRDLGDSLKRITRDEPTVKQHLLNVINKYLEDLNEIGLSDLAKHFDLLKNGATLPLDQIKKELYVFVDGFKNEMEKLPEHAVDKFWHHTHNLQERLNNVDEIRSESHEHTEHLSVRVRTLADLLTSMLQNIVRSENVAVQQREFVQSLNAVLLKVEQNNDIPREIVSKVRKYIGEVGSELDLVKFITLLEVSTTEFQKILMLGEKSRIVTKNIVIEYLNILEWQWRALIDTCGKTQDLEYLLMHIESTTNQIGMYVRGDRRSDEVKDLLESVRRMAVSLSITNLQHLESNHVDINNLLQQVTLELKKLTWGNLEGKSNAHLDLKDNIMNYWIKLQKVYVSEKVHNGGNVLQIRPVEAIFKIDIAANRFSKVLHLLVPEHHNPKLAFQARRFIQVLELVIFRMRQWSRTNNLVEKTCTNLQEIQQDLEKAITLPDGSLKIKLGVYVLDAVAEIKQLALETTIREDRELQTLIGGFLFGLKHIQGQIQYNLQMTTQDYDVKTLVMQFQSVSQRLSVLLQRAQLKPELKHVIFTQIEILTVEVGGLLSAVQEIAGDKTSHEAIAKLNKIYQTLKEVVQTSSGRSVVELTAFLDTYVQTVVMHLEELAASELKSNKVIAVYKRFLSGLTHIMVCLQNIHYYEYYNHIDTRHASVRIHELTTAISSKLESGFADKIKNDIVVQVLKYIFRLHRIAEYLQLETREEPRGLLDTIEVLLQIVRQNGGVSVNEVAKKLATSIRNVEQVLEKSRAGNREVERHVLSRYLVALEELFIATQHAWMRSQHEQTIRQEIADVETNVRYLSLILEHINRYNKDASEVVRSEYHHIVEAVSGIITKFRKISDATPEVQEIIKGLSNVKTGETGDYPNIDDLVISLSFQVQRVECALRELVLVENKKTPEFVAIINDFVKVLQNAYIKLATRVVIPQRVVVPQLRETQYNRNNINSEVPFWRDSHVLNANTPENHENLVNNIRKSVDDVSNYLRSKRVDQGLEDYVRDLLQVVHNIVNNVHIMKNNPSVQGVIKNLETIQNELEHVTRSNAQHLLIDGIERIAFEVERLVRCVRNGEVQVSEKVLEQFLHFVRTLCIQIKENVSERYQPQGLFGPKSQQTTNVENQHDELAKSRSGSWAKHQSIFEDSPKIDVRSKSLYEESPWSQTRQSIFEDKPKARTVGGSGDWI